MVTIPRIVIAGTESGVGKTTIALGLMAALRRRGLTVQPFKAGPDYLDPSHHTLVAGRICRNLDTWLLNDQLIRGVVQDAGAGADVAVIEGVMGLFDGHSSTTDRGSTAELAKLLRAPVILVVDASRMARSAAALVQGFQQFDRAVPVAGVIFNRVSKRHFQLLRDAIRRSLPCPVLGYLPSDPEIAIPERHLGLLPAQEDQRVLGVQARLADQVSASIDLEKLLRVARSAPALPAASLPGDGHGRRLGPCTIGVARDRAFHFYYEDNLRLLQRCGAELVEFSPLADERMPEGLDALYLGGGFPEVFGDRLARNAPLRRQLKAAIQAGLPTYAECGGLMYLAEHLVDHQGRQHSMVGILPGTVRMTNRLQNFGYVSLRPPRATILAKAHDPIKGHEFHYSVWEHHVSEAQAAYVVHQRRGKCRLEGFAHANLLASYIHVHFLTNPRWARGFVASAAAWRNRQKP